MAYNAAFLMDTTVLLLVLISTCDAFTISSSSGFMQGTKIKSPARSLPGKYYNHDVHIRGHIVGNSNKSASRIYSLMPSSQSSDKETAAVVTEKDDASLNKEKQTIQTTKSVTSAASPIPKSSKKGSDEKDDSNNDIIAEAERLRAKARELMAEATSAEKELRVTTEATLKKKNEELDVLLEEFFALVPPTKNSTTATTTNSNVDGNKEDERIQPVIPPEQQEKQLINKSVDILRQKKLSSAKMIQLLERLTQREIKATSIALGSSTITSTSTANTAAFNIGDVSNSKEYTQNEIRKLSGWVERIIEAQSILEEEDGQSSTRSGSTATSMILRSRVRDLRRREEEAYQRKLASGLNNNSDNNMQMQRPTTVDGLMKETFGMDQGNNGDNVTIKIDGKEISGSKANMTKLMEDIIAVPMWVPSSILPFLVVCQDELRKEDLKIIRSEVLKGSRFYCTSSDSMRLAAVFKGTFVNKRTNAISNIKSSSSSPKKTTEVGGGWFQQKSQNISETATTTTSSTSEEEASLSAVAFQEVQERLKASGVGDRIQLFLMEDPEWRPGFDERQSEPQPVLLAVSKGVVPEQASERTKVTKLLTGISAVSTIFSTFAYAVSAYALNPIFFKAVVEQNDMNSLIVCLPIFFGVITLSIVHEVAHLLATKNSGIKLGLPVPLPSLQIGTFGSITPLRSFPDSRTSLFDFAMSGPLITSAVSLLLMTSGIFLTINSSVDTISTLATVPAAIMKSSFLVGSIVSVMAPKVMMLPLSQPIPIHPLFMVGLTGIVASAVNMLPIGRLDGGRACTAVFGRRTAYLISLLTLLFLAISALSGISAISIFWGLLVTLFQRTAEIPVRDEISEVNDVRFNTYVASTILAALVLAPFPGGPGAL